MTIIKVINSESEKTSFPINQSIYLSSTTNIDLENIENKIVLFRLLTDDKLINLTQPYSYTLGYIKETFDIVDLKYEVNFDQSKNYYVIKCTPRKPLNPNSKYCLYLTKQLSESYINIVKNNSKSNSSITIGTNSTTVAGEHTLTISQTSIINDKSNIIKVLLDTVEYTLNLKTKKSLLGSKFSVNFEDTVYVNGESFVITINELSNLENDLQYVFNTSKSDTIAAIPSDQISNTITNNDVLAFYQATNNVIENLIHTPNYLSLNIFSIKIEEGYEIDLSTLQGNLGIAFNNYLLTQLSLYDKDLKYKLIVHRDELENEYIFELVYTDNLMQVELLVIDTSQI